MKIIISPDPILRRTCEPVASEELPQMAKLAKKMARLMYKSDGCGLAAPQVGVTKQLIVLDTVLPEEGEERVQNPIIILNPRIVELGSTTESGGEGCLSIPGITIDIERPTSVTVEALDLEGNEIEISAEGFDARALQHEIDHLEGITMFEHLDPITCATKLQEFAEAKASGARPGDTSVGKAKDDGAAQREGDAGAQAKASSKTKPRGSAKARPKASSASLTGS
ncbi:MAG: peptide deformylase [Coriobacteriales bacterium]|nr:peptide deformylase [Coriobacteriales bacterium]